MSARMIGWNASVPPNGFANRPTPGADNDNPLGLATPVPIVEIETTPEHYNLVGGDPSCAGWTRTYDDPDVSALRASLWADNGIPNLKILGPSDVDAAAELFHRDGFVVIGDALTGARFDALRAATERVVDEILAADPEAGAGGGAGGLPHRYSFGSSSASRHRLHDPAWVDVIDLGTTTPILTAIFGSPDYVVGGGGGDVALPGAIEYQGLHSDNIWTELYDPVDGLSMRRLPVPVVTINFAMVDLTPENGPIRQIPGSQRWTDPIPTLTDEPMWMKRSTVCPVPAGSAIVRDNRAWHGGTPNLSRETRALPNIEYFAPWFRSEGINRCMPHGMWQTLSPHGRRICRYVVCDRDQIVVGAGFTHPRARAREDFVAHQLAELGVERAAEWTQRR